MYQSIYNLISNAVFETTSLSGYQDMIVTIVSTIAILFIISLPFLIVFKIINLIIGR